MAWDAVYRLGIVSAIVGGTAAGVFALLFWSVLRRSPFGTVVALLALTLSGVTFYHVVLFAWTVDAAVLDVVRSLVHTVVAAFLWVAVVMHRRIQRSAGG